MRRRSFAHHPRPGTGDVWQSPEGLEEEPSLRQKEKPKGKSFREVVNEVSTDPKLDAATKERMFEGALDGIRGAHYELAQGEEHAVPAPSS